MVYQHPYPDPICTIPIPSICTPWTCASSNAPPTAWRGHYLSGERGGGGGGGGGGLAGDIDRGCSSGKERGQGLNSRE